MIIAVPAVNPLTTPVALIEATVVAVLLQVPAEVASPSAVVDATHTAVAPDIGAAPASTVTVADTMQPLPSE
jgi:hypothetical protein